MKHIYKFVLLIGFSTFALSTLSAQCFDNGHSPFKDQGWLSCNMSVGPNPDRGEAHWIMYDLGHIYELDSVYFWNYNVWGETGMGLKSILIDYSIDQEEWSTVGPIEIDKAPGSWKYTGTSGPSLEFAQARYVLITVLSTWSDDTSCAGLSEIKFNVGNIVDVTEVQPAVEWSIAPNPASERITIQLPEVDKIKSLTVYNSIGQVVQNLAIPNSTNMVVPVGQLQSGIYFVSINTETEILTKSFVKGS